jgi:hypothetical protein
MLDPNIRPGFIADEARYRARMERLLSLADVVKVSDEDLAWLMGDGDPAVLAEAMRARGPALVLVTEGAEGRHGLWRRRSGPPPRAEGRGRGHRGRGRHVQRGLSGRALGPAALSADAVRAGLPTDALRRARPRRARRRRHRVSRAGANPPAGTNCVRALIQRVTSAEVGGRRRGGGQTGPGLLILVCAMQGDTEAEAERLAAKIAKLRIFEDEAGKMNRALLDTGGGALVVSQFTLAADTQPRQPPRLFHRRPARGG